MSAPVHDDRRKLDEILREINHFKKSAVKVGVLSNSKKHKGQNSKPSEMAMIAATHEYGARINVTQKMRNFLHTIGIHLKAETTTIIIPERSWLRSWVDENKTKINAMILKQLRQVEDGKSTSKTALKRLGVWAKGGIQLKIKNGPFSPLKIRGGRPLNDSGQFRNSINHEVVSR